MQSIVSIMQTSHGESVQLLGLGDDEAEARQAAHARVHSGHNDFDQEHQRGTLLELSPELEALVIRGDHWHGEYEEDGTLVGGEASAAALELERVLHRLVRRGGMLDYRK